MSADKRQVLFPVCGGTAIVDADMVERLAQHSWRMHRTGSVVRTAHPTRDGQRVTATVYMHRFVIDAPSGAMVDHVNGNPSDNRRCNLRLAKPQENQINRTRLSKANKSGFTGVMQTGKRWLGYYHKDGKHIRVGVFDTAQGAFAARQAAVAAAFGDFCPKVVE